MVNAKEELLKKLNQVNKNIEDIDAYCIFYYEFEKCKEINGENPNDLLDFLNFEYDDGYGLQHLFGKILFKDKSWLERTDYDGLEWWEYLKSPNKEELLKGNCNEKNRL